jgi:transposase
MMFRADVQIPETLPRDADFLLQLIADLGKEREVNRRHFELIERKLQELLRRLCGRRSERLNPDQLDLIFGELQRFLTPQDPDSESSPLDKVESKLPTSPRRPHGRRRITKDLPRKRVVIEMEDCRCELCGSTEMKLIGEEVTEKLEYEPAQIYVVEEVRPKYACVDCEECVVTAPKPPEAIPKCLAGPGLLAHVLTSKYADHLPLYRQQGIFRRLGLSLSRSTMCDWCMACGERFQSVVDFMTDQILQSLAVHTDDTVVPVLAPELGVTRKGRLWVYVGDRHHRHVVFDYTPTRERDGPAHFLRDFSGYLQADAYAGYDGIYATQNVLEVACWAHARRKFYEILVYETVGLHVTALAFIDQLYLVEDRCKHMESDERRDFRGEHAVPVLHAFKQWTHEQLDLIRPKSPIAQAIGYVMRQWDALMRYTEHGDLSIDNNIAERMHKLIAVGRKNWLFAGSDLGARRNAVIFSLVASCQLHGVDPSAYFRWLLERLSTCPPDRLGELTPLVFAQPAQLIGI